VSRDEIRGTQVHVPEPRVFQERAERERIQALKDAVRRRHKDEQVRARRSTDETMVRE
jgi:hypothetical protein